MAELIRHALEIRLRAERRIGGMLEESVQHDGGVARCDSSKKLPPDITRSDSSRWQRIASLPDDLRHLELVENVQRLNLDSYELSKERLREIEAAAEEVAQDGPVSKGGRGKKGGDREVARQTGISRQEIARTRKHVETAEEFPEMQGNGWR